MCLSEAVSRVKWFRRYLWKMSNASVVPLRSSNKVAIDFFAGSSNQLKGEGKMSLSFCAISGL